MSDYLKEIKGLCDQLKSVTQEKKIFASLQGLGRDYEPIKTSIEGAMNSPLAPTFEDIVPRLTSFEDRLKSYDTSQTLSFSLSPHLTFHVSTNEPRYSSNTTFF